MVSDLRHWCMVAVGILLLKDLGSAQNPSTDNYIYKGCYLRGKGDKYLSDENWTEYCYQKCSKSNYFGLKSKSCICLSSIDTEATQANNCTERCPGNADEICGELGSPGLMSVYQTRTILRKGRMTVESDQMTLTNDSSLVESGRNENTTNLNNTSDLHVASTTDNPSPSYDTSITPNITTVTQSRDNTTDKLTQEPGNTTDDVMQETDNTTADTHSDTSVNTIDTGDTTTLTNKDNTSFHGVKIKPNLSDLIQDIDEGLVAGMSVLVVVLFASCFLVAFARKCYRRSRRKPETTIYEEVEDAATSCSIEGSSNIKFLIGRARNINKSRIEQINEEWKTGNPLLRTISGENSSIISPPSSPTPLPETEMQFFPKSSIKSNQRVIIEDEDSEYATAEPVDDMYASAQENNAETSLVRETMHTGSSSAVTVESNALQNKLQRSLAFDQDTEDPYEIAENGEYDTTNTVRPHKQTNNEQFNTKLEEDPYVMTEEGEYDTTHCMRPHKHTSNEEFNKTPDVENPYVMTEEGEYDTLGEIRPHVGESLHRSKSLERLSGKLNTPEAVSESESIELFYDDSFEGEYDVLNKARFRFTISSDNYDNVKLPWENETAENKNENSFEPDNTNQTTFEDLEPFDRAQPNLYSDMESLIKSNENSDVDKSEPNLLFDQSEMVTNNVEEINGNNNLNNESNCDNVKSSTLNESNVEHSSNDSAHLSELSSTELLDNTNVVNSNNDENDVVVIQNKCFGYAMENGNIMENEMDVC